MKYVRLPILVSLVSLTAALSCSSGFSRVGPNARLSLAITGGDPQGSPDQRRPLSFTKSSKYTMTISALLPDGTTDTSFNGTVRASVKPGTVVSVTGPGASGRNVQLQNGTAQNVTVEVVAAYGDARIWFEDMGYVPADPTRQPPPQCSDGVDNNGDGLVDFPADPGCAYANDDTETGGTFATGTTTPIFFVQPRVADVRGVPAGGNGTTFPHEQVQIDTGWRGAGNFAFSTIVTRVAADGFYVTDLQNDSAPGAGVGYGSVYSFTYSTPPLMRVCDRIKLLGGTASDFFGFTEIGFPTWLIEEWDPTQRPCMVPEPHPLTIAEYIDPASMFKLEAGFVRIALDPQHTYAMHVTQKLGPSFPDKATGFLPTADATNCDFNHNGKVDFTGGDEQLCSTMCDGGTLPSGTVVPPDPECTEFSAFAGHGDFKLSVTDTSATSPSPVKVQVNASASALFDPIARRGQPVKAFAGTVRYFSGGNQWTIEARCDDDIVTDLSKDPLPSTVACVHPRTQLDLNEGSH